MSSIIFECEVTEYNIIPPKENTHNAFNISNSCLVISFCDSDDNVITQSEISIEDARKLAKLILCD